MTGGSFAKRAQEPIRRPPAWQAAPKADGTADLVHWSPPRLLDPFREKVEYFSVSRTHDDMGCAQFVSTNRASLCQANE
jgi:hypothetical protein